MLQLDGTGPLYHQIYRALRDEILSRNLAPGERVPSTRELSGLLKISRNAAVSAYEQLLAEGYLETRLGAAGTVVAAVLPPDSPHFSSSNASDQQRHTLRPTGVRLALAGERILSAARKVAASLELSTLTWEPAPRASGTISARVEQLFPICHMHFGADCSAHGPAMPVCVILATVHRRGGGN